MTTHWTENNIPSQNGRVAIVTGANSGIGWETARALAQKGATVIMACRNAQKASTAADQINALKPVGKVVVMVLDLGDLDSVQAFAVEFLKQYDRLDLLINNAGVMIPPYGKTVQGFEQQFGINHLGHFALTGLLLERLNATRGARIVTVSSGSHRFGIINFDDLNWERGYPGSVLTGKVSWQICSLPTNFSADSRRPGRRPLPWRRIPAGPRPICSSIQACSNC